MENKRHLLINKRPLMEDTRRLLVMGTGGQGDKHVLPYPYILIIIYLFLGNNYYTYSIYIIHFLNQEIGIEKGCPLVPCPDEDILDFR